MFTTKRIVSGLALVAMFLIPFVPIERSMTPALGIWGKNWASLSQIFIPGVSDWSFRPYWATAIAAVIVIGIFILIVKNLIK
ncbi:MAG: hypothetical protein MK193_05210 [Lentisphaeria bacterium]|nr:hypothetical protein [Lentisphaeria bacterium]